MLSERMSRSSQSLQSLPNKHQENLWTSLLSSVASSTAKTQTSKTIIVLGGRRGGAEHFIQNLRNGRTNQKTSSKRETRVIPMDCDIGIGYTYFDLEDRDEEDIVARINVHMITETEPSLIDMLAALLESISLKDTIMCILLDWNCPWSWLREMRFWLRQWERTIKLLKTSSQKSQSDIEDFQISWQSHLRTFTEDPKGKVNGLAQLDAAIVLPLSEGQFDHSLGVPLICVAQNAESINILDQVQGVKDEHFDFIQQVIRTVIHKHGGSLIYTTPVFPNTSYLPLRLLIRNHLPSVDSEVQNGVRSDKASVLVRDQVFVPAGWDSWGKIKALREGFDVEGVAAGWEIDLDPNLDPEAEDAEVGAVDVFEEVVQDLIRPHTGSIGYTDQIITSLDPLSLLQEIEQRQWEVDENASSQSNSPGLQMSSKTVSTQPSAMQTTASIDLDGVEAKLKSLRHRAGRLPSQPSTPSVATNVSKSGANKDEYVQAFFQNLLTRSNSQKNVTPKE